MKDQYINGETVKFVSINLLIVRHKSFKYFHDPV